MTASDKMGDEIRYHFYVTNVPAAEMSAPDVNFQCNARCNQENVIKRRKNVVQAMVDVRQPATSSRTGRPWRSPRRCKHQGDVLEPAPDHR